MTNLEDITLSYDDIKQMYALITGISYKEDMSPQSDYKIKGNKYNKTIVNLQFEFLTNKHGMESGLEKFCEIYDLPYLSEFIEKIFENKLESTSRFLAHYLKYMSLKQFQ